MKRNSFLKIAILCALVLPWITACSLFQRTTASGYFDRNTDDPGVSRDRRNNEMQAAIDELGFGNRELTEAHYQAIYLRIALRKAERSLDAKAEREQYFKNKPYMRTDRDRLEFLQLDSMNARQRWLSMRGIQGSATAHPPEIQALISINDITLYMTKEAVKQSWGEPELVEVAGNPVYGNERWHYSGQISSADGFQTEQRLVYFESGRVIGWEKR